MVLNMWFPESGYNNNNNNNNINKALIGGKLTEVFVCLSRSGVGAQMGDHLSLLPEGGSHDLAREWGVRGD